MTPHNRCHIRIPITVRSILLTVTIMLLFGCNLQHQLLYFPSASLPTDKSLTAAHLKLWPSPAPNTYRGLTTTSEAQYHRGTVIVFHGNAGTAVDREFYIDSISPLGYRVILAEYPRYGGRKGELGEKAFVADAVETVRLAFAQFGTPLYLLGESLGCGVAAATATQSAISIKGIILITPWDTLAAIAHTKFPLLPVQLLLTDSYDNISNLSSFPGRIAVVGAEQDEIIPLRHAEDLYRALTTPNKRMWRIKGAGHNNVLFHTNQTWWREMMAFVSGTNNN